MILKDLPGVALPESAPFTQSILLQEIAREPNARCQTFV